MDDNEDPRLKKARALLARRAVFRAEVRREREADMRSIDNSLKAIRESCATLARCVVWSPLVDLKRKD